jgi:ferric-dicitrate binding protein FerR (iron transport regulator)
MDEKLNIDREVLFFRYCEEIATPEEKKLTERLVEESGTLAGELEQVKQAVGLQQKIKGQNIYDTHAGYSRVQYKIRKKGRIRKRVSTLYRVAAMLTIPLLITTLVFGYMVLNKDNEKVVYAEIVSAPGVVSQFEFPDQSKVWLNSESKLRYPSQFKGNTREVELEGEAYFEVQSNKERPFYVATPSGLKIMAYGTRFNVNANENKTETTLVEGHVAILNQEKILKELHPEDEVLFDNTTGKLELQNVNLYEKLAWKDGKIVFRNASLDKVFARLSKRYNVDIVLHDEHHLAEKYSSIRVTFSNETIQQIFSYLEIAAPIEWKVSPIAQNEDSALAKQRIDVWLKKE